MVVLGNQPYHGESENKGQWILKKLLDYSKDPNSINSLEEINYKWLNDD